MANRYEYVQRTIQRRRDWVNEQKQGPCAHCGVCYPSYVMDFHHRDPEDKLFSIAWGVSRVSRARLAAEIDKCDLLCANCHRIEEYSTNSDVQTGIAAAS